MIVDVHSHVWKYPDHFSEDFRTQANRARAGVEVDLTVRHEDYSASATVDTAHTVVFGGKARLSGLWVDDYYVAEYANTHENVVGFLSIDPTQENWEQELQIGHKELGLRGIKLLPMYAGFFPNDSVLDPLWHYAQDHGLPVVLHTGTTFIAQAPIKCTLPRHIDAVARKFPHVRICMGHLGHPYESETIAVIRKHEHVYADVSALHYRPWQLYNSLMLVQEYGVWHKLLFGTDFPFTTVDSSVAGLRSLNDMLIGSHLPRLNSDEIEQLIYRDSLRLLGLA